MTGLSSLVFDNTLELCDPDGHVSSESYYFEALADSASWGDAKPIEVVLNSLMRDGAITVTTGDENRETTFLVKVKGTDSDSLDAGVQALQLATRKRTTLVWTPPDGYCEPRVWDVETSNLLEPNGFDDLAYMLRNEQVFRLRLVCLPYRRSAEETVDDAGTPPSGGGTLLYNCESTTGWAAQGGDVGSYAVDGTIFTEGAGSLRSQTINSVGHIGTSDLYIYHYSYANVLDQVTGLSMSTGTGGYLSIAVRTEWSENIPGLTSTTGLTDLSMQVGGVWSDVTFVPTALDADGFIHYVWAVDAGLTVTGLRFRVDQFRLGDYASRPYVWFDDFELLPSATTDHQIVKQHFVLGSARTTGSIQISAPSEVVALDKVLVITMPTDALPAGFQPDGRRWVTQGDTDPDVDLIPYGGEYFTPDSSTYSDATGVTDRPIFDVPVGMLTAGPYAMVALVKVETPPLIAGVQAQLLVDGTGVGPTSAAEVSIPDLDTGWTFVPLGTVYLPPLPVQNADDTTKVRLLFKGAKLADVYMIPAMESDGWPVADFTIVDCGDGTVEPGGASSSLFLDSPSTMQPQGAAWRGPTTDRANAQKLNRRTEALKVGTHFFKPGSLTNFVVSLGAAGPTSTLRYFKRFL